MISSPSESNSMHGMINSIMSEREVNRYALNIAGHGRYGIFNTPKEAEASFQEMVKDGVIDADTVHELIDITPRHARESKVNETFDYATWAMNIKYDKDKADTHLILAEISPQDQTYIFDRITGRVDA